MYFLSILNFKCLNVILLMKYLYVSLVSSFNKNNIKIIRMKIVYLLSYVHESTQEETAVL